MQYNDASILGKWLKTWKKFKISSSIFSVFYFDCDISNFIQSLKCFRGNYWHLRHLVYERNEPLKTSKTSEIILFWQHWPTAQSCFDVQKTMSIQGVRCRNLGSSGFVLVQPSAALWQGSLRTLERTILSEDVVEQEHFAFNGKIKARPI